MGGGCALWQVQLIIEEFYKLKNEQTPICTPIAQSKSRDGSGTEMWCRELAEVERGLTRPAHAPDVMCEQMSSAARLA